MGVPVPAADFEVKRPSVSKKRIQRTGPTLPSELEPEPVEREPTASEEAWEEYYREKAEYYREKRRERQPARSSAGTCMYGADGKVIYAPPGRSCRGPAAPLARGFAGPQRASPRRGAPRRGATLPPAVTTVSLGSLRLVVEHRRVGGLGGPTLRVLEAVPRDRELLRFDCFDEGAHWHLDPGDRDLVTRLEPGVDPLEWTLGELRRDLAGYLARAAPGLTAPDPAFAAVALDAAESALRNPPVDLDAVRPELRRPSRGEKWTQYPADVLPLWVADMDFPVAEPIRRVLRFAVDRSDLGYPIHPAPTDVPEITVTHMHERFGWLPDPTCVEILTDVVQGMYVAVQQFSEPGEGVVVQTPIYPPFLGCVRTLKRRLIENPLGSGPSGPGVDVEALREVVDDSTRVILLCNPHNPTGRVFRREELEGIAKLALERDLVVVSDEIHADLVYSGNRHVPFASLSSDVEARTITLSAASKAFNVAGLRCAVAIFGSQALKRRFNQLPRHLRGGVSLPGIEALRAAWRHGRPWLDQVLAYLERNRDAVTGFVRDQLPGIRLHPPEATYLAWLDCRDLALEPSPYEFFLQRARVALSDGPSFGTPGRGFVRINFATSRAILDDALGRMATSLN